MSIYQEEKKPSFFIVGAPKSGTTALSEYLREHPNVFISHPKEPHYFASDMIKHRIIKNIDDYLQIFENANDDQKAIGEASVWYLHSKKAIKNIQIFNPDAKIIVMLRKPVDMVYSMHSQHLHSLGEDETCFETAWDLEDERKKGNYIPKYILHLPNLYYSEIANYYSQLLNVYKYFSKEQVKVILFDDFKDNPKKVFDDVQNYLEVPFYEKNDFKIVNPNTVMKSRKVEELLKNNTMLNFRKKIKSYLGIQSFGVRSQILKYNSIALKRKPINEHVKKRVIENYKEEVNELSKLLDIDLSHWNN